MMIEMGIELIASLVEGCLLGVFALVEIIKSKDLGSIYALILVAMMAIGSTVLIGLLNEYCEENKKFKKKKKKKKKSVGSKKTNSRTKSVKSKNMSNTSNKNLVETKTVKNNVTRIDIKKDIVTPGVRGRKRKI